MCEYCEKGKSMCNRNTKDLGIELDSGTAKLVAYTLDGFGWDISVSCDIKYCPMCGRRTLMTNEQREAIETMQHWIEYEKEHKNEINKADELIHIQDTVLSLIKGSQTEKEIYKEELDSIYKALDIERGVARPRTYEIIQALKNTIKSQAKQIENTKALYDRALSDLVKADKQIDLYIEELISNEFDRCCQECCKECEKDKDTLSSCIKQYFERKVENEQ